MPLASRTPTWTLKDLHEALGQRLSTPPSPATLKAWSRQRLWPASATLAQASDAILQRIESGAVRLRGPRVAARRDVAPATAAPAPSQALQEIQEIRRALQDLTSTTSARADSTAPTTLPPALQKAIEQIDATRRHLMQLWDAQRHANSTAAPAAPSKAQDSPDQALEWHRLHARLARIESRLDEILSRLGDTA